MSELHGREPLRFDEGTADALVAALRATADAIEGQAAARASYVSTAAQEFRGYFARLFAENAETAAADARELVAGLREVAGWAGVLKESARREDERRRRAREWHARVQERRASWVLSTWDDVFGEEPPPADPVEPAPVFPARSVSPRPRHTPRPGAGGSSGGTSSARPDDLRTFASGSSRLDLVLAGRPRALSARLADFEARCQWGRIDADGLVTGLERWLAANDEDVAWATTVADAFAAAGGEGVVFSVSDAALALALQAGGVSASRQELVVAPPQAFGAPPTTGYALDPVNTSTGNFLETEVDLAFAGASTSLRLERTYNSLDERSGLFGPGWTSVLETALEIGDDGAVLTMADGRQVRFPRLADGWDRGVGENYWLGVEDAFAFPVLERAGTSGELLVVRDNAGGWWAFSRAGTWLGAGTGPGTAVLAERDAEGRVTALVHERGRRIDVEHADGRVASVTGSDGRRLEYGYDDGRLVAVRSALGTRSYRWNAAGLIEAVVGASGVVETVNTYDERRRVVEQSTPHGRRVRFGYLPGRVTLVSDEDGRRSNAWQSDAKGRVVGVLDAEDRRQSMSYDPHGNLVSVTERDGATTVHAYDEAGRRVRTVTPSGADITYGYDDLDRVVTVVTESGAVVTYEYVGVERDPSVIVDPEGGRTELVWQDGLLTQVVDPADVTVWLEYDELGDLVSTTNALGDVARIERDGAGRPVAAVSPSGARTTYTYDDAGLLVARQDPDGAVWRFEHTAGGKVSAVVDPLGARTELEYGPSGDLVRTVDPLGRATTRMIDDQGNVAGVRLPDGAEWAFSVDALSRLREVTDPSGHVWGREYDPTGALSSVVDPTGVRQEVARDRAGGTAQLRDAFATTTITFDEYGRPTTVEAPDGSSELTVYDRCGRPIELVDGEGGLTRLERDAAGRVVAVVSPSGARTTYEYDLCGRPVARTDAAGARTTLTYDADSRVVARTLPTGEVERIEYDAVGRVTARHVPGGGVARFGYDKAGRLTWSQDSWYGQRRYRYDAAGQLVATVNGLGGVTRFEHDERGRVVAVTDPAGGVTRRTFDQLDRVTSVTDPLGRTTRARYDAAGRRVWQRDPDGRVTEWEFDATGRESAVRVDGRTVSTVARDPRSRTVVVTDTTRPDGVPVEHRLTYDRRGLLVRRTRGDGALTWEYDADGNRVAMTAPDGVRTTYGLDAAGRATSVGRPGTGEATVSYDAAGRVTRCSAGGVLQSWQYGDGYVTEHARMAPGGVESTRLVRDAFGRVVRVEGPRAPTVYAYDDAHQLVSVRRSDGTATTWQYDVAGRLVREQGPGLVRQYRYDPAGQLLEVLSDDALDGQGRDEYAYDGLGRRTAVTAGDGTSVRYAWGDVGRLERVVRQDAEGVTLEETTLWVDALGELAEVDGAPVWWDTAASVPALVSVAGTPVLTTPGGATGVGGTWVEPGWRTVRSSAADDPWAVDRLVELPDAGLPHGLSLTPTGGLSISGLEWLGARAYDPSTRGFLSTDPLPAVLGSGWAGNPYSYAGNDPLHASDPLGLRPVTDAELLAYATGTQGRLAGAAGAADGWAGGPEHVAAGALAAAGAALMLAGVAGPAETVLSGSPGGAQGGLLAGGHEPAGSHEVVAGHDAAAHDALAGHVDWARLGVHAITGAAVALAGAGVLAWWAGRTDMFARSATGAAGAAPAGAPSGAVRGERSGILGVPGPAAGPAAVQATGRFAVPGVAGVERSGWPGTGAASASGVGVVAPGEVESVAGVPGDAVLFRDGTAADVGDPTDSWFSVRVTAGPGHPAPGVLRGATDGRL
ncbi:type IV secretion protein Rhs [Xylanimonas oleitrophica]|uniref:Type IV secretion protein Rhs n=1 Tax=Xylanimonas oleitrophica TaxID=2607479 RepID=A0A2W5X0H0_9MICO|nr:DUF6531 domain-containing protein [Xylanimonas oleitrophica]PZR53735.1 type IV secretion protein Rhs [Xylanimonas oleitrophica]